MWLGICGFLEWYFGSRGVTERDTFPEKAIQPMMKELTGPDSANHAKTDLLQLLSSWSFAEDLVRIINTGVFFLLC